jgi:hypothetical protein
MNSRRHTFEQGGGRDLLVGADSVVNMKGHRDMPGDSYRAGW